jgi:hypothetical protein
LTDRNLRVAQGTGDYSQGVGGAVLQRSPVFLAEARGLERNFREELMGDMQPPAAHYRVESGDNSSYAEFLTPLEGSAVKRGGKREVTARVSGVSVQKLRYLELLLQNPWGVMIAPATG